MALNFGAIVSLLPAIIQAIDLARSINNQKTSGTKVIDLVRGNLPAVVDLFSGVGQTLFPELPQEKQVAAAAVVLDGDAAKLIQAKLNGLGANPRLVVDGSYGPKTKEAVKVFQTAHGLTVDGWAGPLTQQAMGI